MDGWNTIVSSWNGLFSGAISGRVLDRKLLKYPYQYPEPSCLLQNCLWQQIQTQLYEKLLFFCDKQENM